MKMNQNQKKVGEQLENSQSTSEYFVLKRKNCFRFVPKHKVCLYLESVHFQMALSLVLLASLNYHYEMQKHEKG